MLQNEWLVWIGHRKDPSILFACPTPEHTSPQVTSAFEILFEIPANAVFRFEVPVANLQPAVQELQIGGTLAGKRIHFGAFS